MRECWIDNYPAQRDAALYSIPYLPRLFVGRKVHGIVVTTLHGQGCGRLSSEEVDTFRKEIWHTFEDMLEIVREEHKDATEPFWILGGDKPTEADVTLFSFIASIESGKAYVHGAFSFYARCMANLA